MVLRLHTECCLPEFLTQLYCHIFCGPRCKFNLLLSIDTVESVFAENDVNSHSTKLHV